MAMLLHSVDRSFCVERCLEVGVCYKSSIGYLCLCDSGEVGVSCGPAVGVTLSIPTEILSYWPFFVAWVILGVVVGFVTLFVMWLKQRRSRMVAVPVDVEAPAVAMVELEPAVDGMELEPLGEDFERWLPVDEYSLPIEALRVIGRSASDSSLSTRSSRAPPPVIFFV
ncbi:unnamed protein product [Nippostrongylus brasiliensis]|uniref:EGF-like domain-containing protein n=1 Tax=Nippostrongylus brasiliensis TaxID=27835 RepID=A0A0N4Y681_NIPBR|nr:unnamed protein product [Nippostrongylus brasiliensis]